MACLYYVLKVCFFIWRQSTYFWACSKRVQGHTNTSRNDIVNAVAINKLLVAYQLFFIHYFYRIYTIWFLVSFPRFIFSNISFTHPSKMHPSIRRSKPSQSSSSRMLVVGNISLENLREIVGHLGTFGTLVLRSY